MKAIVSERGQITLPKAIRKSLGLRPGSILDFNVEDGKLVGRKKDTEDPVAKWRGRGILPKGCENVDDYLEKARG